jgi:protein-disulfide isomerase
MERAWIGFVVLIAALTGVVLWTTTGPQAANAGALSAPTPEVDGATVKAVRDTLLANPEIIPEAIARYQQREVATLLRTNRAELETPFPGAVAGNPDGTVVLVEFFDFRCPFCRRSNDDVQALIRANPELKVVYRPIPALDRQGQEPLSRSASELALAAAAQDRYVAFHNAVFGGPGRISQETLVQSARQAGLDERRAVSDARGQTVQAAIARNLELGRMLGVSGTPTYVIGDEIIEGAVGAERLQQAISALK